MDSNLKASLQNLHTHLASSGPVDAELENLLQQLDGDIQQLLVQREAAREAAQRELVAPPVALVESETSASYGLAERSQELSAKFAVKHPHLEPALRELGQILSNMGI